MADAIATGFAEGPELPEEPHDDAQDAPTPDAKPRNASTGCAPTDAPCCG